MYSSPTVALGRLGAQAGGRGGNTLATRSKDHRGKLLVVMSLGAPAGISAFTSNDASVNDTRLLRDLQSVCLASTGP